MKRKLLSLFLAAALVFTCVPRMGRITASAAGNGALKNLVIDEIPLLSPAFKPGVTSYTAETYVSVDKATVHPLAASGAEVTVNGKALNGDGRAEVPLSLGENNVTVAVKDDGVTTNYSIAVTKHDTDYEGMKRVPRQNISVTANSTAAGSDPANMFDGDGATWWRAGRASQPGSEVVLTFDLGRAYSVNRMWFTFLPKNLPLQNSGDYSKSGKIWASEDGINWTLALDKAAYRTETGNIWYELGDVKARFLRYQIATYNHNAAVQNAIAQIGEMDIYYNPSPEIPDYPEKENEPAFIPGNDKLSRSSEITLEQGLQITTWLPSPGYGRKAMSTDSYLNSYMTGPLFYDPPMFNTDFMRENPNTQWALAKAPWGANHMGGTGDPRDYITDEMRPYINNLVSVCFGDEGGYSTSEAERYGGWFDLSKALYPQAMVHTNQWGGQWSTAQLKEYMRIAEPDLLAFDAYYWDEYGSLKDWNSAGSLLGSANYQREAALGGIDGTGTKPIVFGQYLGCYKNGASSFASGWYEATASQKNAVLNLSLAVGMKWFDLFRTEYEFGSCYLFDEDGRPTRHYYEWAEAFRQARNIGDHIVRLNSDTVVSQPGQHMENGSPVSNNAPSGWRMGSFAANESKNQEYYIQNVAAQNLGAENDGLNGDVALGYFTKLPGLDDGELQSYFGCTAPKGFMVVNGLMSGNGLRPEKQHGSLAETRQQITLTFEEGAPALKKVSRETGRAEDVTPVPQEDGTSTLTLTLGGGEGDLFFWVENGSDSGDGCAASSSSAEHPAVYAFDGNPQSYWQAGADAKTPITVEKRFDSAQTIGKAVLNEQGNAVTSFQLQYLPAKDGEWTDVSVPGGALTAIGASKSVSFASQLSAWGIRLVVTAANGTPAMGEIRTYTGEREKTVDINDSDMGTAVNRIEYGGDWIYSEPNRNDVTPLIGKDYHFSKWDGSTATVHFYGKKLELFGRGFGNSSDATISIDGGAPVTIARSGSGNFKSVYTSPVLEQKLHTAVVTCSKQSSDSADRQWIIDGARITYTGSIPGSREGDTVTTYVNDNDASIAYTPQASNSSAEGSGWRIAPQSGNSGYTTTTQAGNSYAITFTGTEISLYAPRNQLGSAKISLDGEELAGKDYVKTGNQDGNALCVLTVSAGDTNEEHVLKVEAKSGRSRLEYATVTALAETGGTPVPGNTIAVTVQGSGAATPVTQTVADNEDAVLTIQPQAGWVLSSILVDGAEAALPQGETFVLYNVTDAHAVTVIFEQIQAVQSVKPVSEINVDYGTDFSLLQYLNLPKQATVVLADGTEKAVPVLWEAGDYTGDKTGSYPLKGVLQLPQHLSNAGGLTASVTVRVNAVKTALNELLARAAAVAEGTYSDSSYKKMKEAAAAAKIVADKTNATQAEVDEQQALLTLALDNLRVDTQSYLNAIARAQGALPADYTANSYKLIQPAVDAAKGAYQEFGVTQTKLDAYTAALTEVLDALVSVKALRTTAEYAGELSTEKLSATILARFKAALKNAEDMLLKENASQLEVDAANKALLDLLDYFDGDPAALNEAIAKAKKIDLSLYEDGTVKDAFRKALADAEDIVENNPLASELAKAQETLEQAVKDLETVRLPEIDLAALQAAADKAKAMYENLNQYVENADTAAFKAAYEQAVGLLETPTSQADVTVAAQALTSAMGKLQARPGLENLLDLIAKAESVNLDGYTKKSADALREALKAAKDAAGSPASTQADIDKILEDLQGAVSGLEKDSGSVPTTGEALPLLLIPAVMAGALMVLFLMKRKQTANEN